ncbi:hypothetical protein ACFE04_022898 [Oxalis oulophora]
MENLRLSQNDHNELEYQSGFGNNFESEALPGALPRGQNSPLICPWLYRIKPSVTHEPLKPRVPAHDRLVSEFDKTNSCAGIAQLRWMPVEIPNSSTDFIDGLYTVCGAGSSFLHHGFAIHMYAANKSMDNCAFCSADGDFLIVPQKGRLSVKTEFGRLQVCPGEILVLPQGLRFAIDLPDGPSSGYVAEIFGAHFELPDLGPIGFTIVQKFGGELFAAKQDFSPFNVVAWHGNYCPYKYDLSKFCPYNTALIDHADPSIYTALTVATDKPGVPLLNFMVFPPRWFVAEHTFRPQYYHRNCMSEFMGRIFGGNVTVDGVLPGGATLECCMTPHGLGLKTYDHHLLLQEFIHVAIKHALPEEFVYDYNSGSNGDGALIFAPGCQTNAAAFNMTLPRLQTNVAVDFNMALPCVQVHM